MKQDISGYSGRYSIDTDGNIYSNIKDIIMKSSNKDGYRKIKLIDSNGTPKSHSVHRLVAMTYIPNPNNLPQIDHIDEDKTNNRLENLRWCTHEQNHEFYDHSRLPTTNIPRSIYINGELFESLNKASKYIANKEGKNKDSINREMRRFMDSGREVWNSYGKYKITKVK